MILSSKWWVTWVTLLMAFCFFPAGSAEDATVDEPFTLNTLFSTTFPSITGLFEEFTDVVLSDVMESAFGVLDSLGAGPMLQKGIEMKDTLAEGISEQLEDVIEPLEEFADDFHARIGDIEEILHSFGVLFSGDCINETSVHQTIAATQQKVAQKNREMNVQESCSDTISIAVTMAILAEVSGGPWKWTEVAMNAGFEVDVGIQFPCNRLVVVFLFGAGVSIGYDGTEHPLETLHKSQKQFNAKHATQEQPHITAVGSKIYQWFKDHTSFNLGLGLGITKNTGYPSPLYSMGMGLSISLNIPTLLPIPFLETIGAASGIGELECINWDTAGAAIGFKTFPLAEIHKGWRQAFKDIGLFLTRDFRQMSKIKELMQGSVVKNLFGGIGVAIDFTYTIAQLYGSDWRFAPDCGDPSPCEAPNATNGTNGTNYTNATNQSDVCLNSTTGNTTTKHQKFIPLQTQSSALTKFEARNAMLAEQFLPILEAQRQKFHVTGLSEIAHFIKAVLASVQEKKDIIVPFCLGVCDALHTDPSYTAHGLAKISLTSTCNGVAASVQFDYLSVGLLLNVLGAQNSDAVLASIGIQNTELSLRATPEYIRLGAYGSPWVALPATDGFAKLVSDMMAHIVLGAELQVFYGGSMAGTAALELSFGLAPEIISDNFAIIDVNGKQGPKFFLRVQLTVTPFDVSMKLGASFPVRVCVERCHTPYTEAHYLYFTGTLALAVSPSQQSVSGQLTMEGWWYNVLLIPFLHINNIILGITFDMKGGGLPTGLTIGGAACVGTKYSCSTRTGYYIEARAYLGLDVAAPDNTFFVVMVTELTFRQIFGIISDMIHVDLMAVPNVILETGIYPYSDDPSCKAVDPASQEKPHDLNMDCYAYISYSGKPQILPFKLETMYVPLGLVMKGKLNLFGWHMKVALEVSSQRIKIDADMDFLALPNNAHPILRIGRTLVDNQAEGNPQFHLELQRSPTPSAKALIQAAFDIPPLRSYGSGELILNAQIFMFDSKLYLFGGIWSPKVKVMWTWNLTYFELALEDIGLAGIIKLTHFNILLDRTNQHFKFSGEVSIFCLIRIGGSLEYQSINEVQTIDYEVHANVVVGFAKFWGTITLDSHSIFNSKVTFHGGVEFSLEAVKEIGRQVVGAVVAIVNYAVEAWNRVEKRVERRWATVKAIADTEFKDMAALIAKGDLSGAVTQFGNLVATTFEGVLGTVMDVLQEIGSFMMDVLSFIFGGYVENKVVRDTGNFNEVGCPIQQVHIHYCTTIIFFDVCEWRDGNTFADPDCMNRKSLAAAQVNKTLAEIAAFNEIVRISKEENPGVALSPGQLDNLAELIHVGNLTIGQLDPSGAVQAEIPTEVPVYVSPTPTSSKFHTLLTSGASPFTDTPAAVTHGAALDFKDPMVSQLSLLQTTGDVGSKMTGTLLAGQGHFRPELLAAAMITLAPPVLGPSSPAVLRCDQNISLGELAPPIIYAHPLCGSGIQVVLEDRHALSAEEFQGAVCGSRFYSLHWRAYDHRACGQHSALVEQNLISLPAPPVFVKVPGPVTITTGDSLDPDALGRPVGRTACGHEFNITYHDEPPVTQSCGKWTIKRIWTITLYLDPSGCVMPQDMSTSATQFITVVDNEAPNWVYLPPSLVEVPFFENYQAISPLPLVEETGHPDMIALGLVSYPARLSSKDGALVHSSTAPEEENSCQERGIAMMNRTWTVTDACGNSRSFQQGIMFQYPPATFASVQPWIPESRLFSYAPGVEPVRDACNPGKRILGGPKSYVATHGKPISNDTCVPGGWWSPNGCREDKWANFKFYQTEVHAPAPYFTEFPADVDISNEDSLDPDVNDELGVPIGAAYCSSPFTISYHDAPPVKQGCGLWTIERTWKIQPHYLDCGGEEATYPAALTTTRVQKIGVYDQRAPEWVSKPPAVLHIPFFSNYLDVDYSPVVREGGSADMLALGLVSYPITTTILDDPVVISSMALDSCNGGLGMLHRNWTMSDACGNSRSFHQTIIFDSPGNKLLNTQHWRPSDVDLAPADRDITSPDRLFAYAPRVDQLADVCYPGKKVTTGLQSFVLVPPDVRQVRCSAGWWSETACRLGSEPINATSIDLVHDFPVNFAYFPPDVSINTSSSLSPTALGKPTGASHCGTPFNISYHDAPPVQRGCGMWSIERTWKIQPLYADCEEAGGTYPDVLTQKRVQRINVTDNSPPQFIQTPQQDVSVEFLEEYGTNVTGVPLVEDVADNSAMADLKFISYPITLSYQDVAVKFFTGQASYREGMAVLSRQWTTKDACANVATWTQTIRVRNPNTNGRAGPLGNVGNYTAFSTQELQSQTTIFVGSIASYSNILLQNKDPTVAFSNLIPRYNDTFTQFSTKLLTFRPRLFTPKPNPCAGPAAIMCTGVPQYTCKVIRMAVPTQTAVSYDAADNMILEGDGLLYNIFNDIDIDRWRYVPPKLTPSKVTPPAPKQIIRAEGFVIVNIVYSSLDATKTMLRETKFEQRFPAGDPFVLYNLKNIPEQPIQNMNFFDTKLSGSLISQHAWNEITFQNTVVTGQVIAVHKRLAVTNCEFQGRLFTPNYRSP